MDNNNWRSTQPGGEPAVESGDWRAQLQPDSRHRIVNKIMETLKRHLPFSGQEGLQELRKIAVRFEEKIYSAATSQSDYLRKISLKMLTMETKSQSTPLASNPGASGSNPVQSSMQNQVPNQGLSLPSNQSQSRQQMLAQNIQNNMAATGAQGSSGLTSAAPPVSGLTQTPISNLPGQNPNMQNISGVSQSAVGNSMGQGAPSNVFSNPQGQMQGRQHVVPQQQPQQSQNTQQYLYQQQLKQQLLNKKFQQGNIPQSLMQSHIQRQQQQQQQQQQQNILQPSQLQSVQQSVMQTSSVMQPSGMQTAPLSGLQPNQPSLQQPTQSILQQHPQSVLRQQQQQQQQPQQTAGIHQQQSSMSQQQMLPQQQQQQQQPLLSQQPGAGNMQQNQLIGQQQNQLIGQQNNVGDMQQHQQQQRLLGQQNNLSNLQQQQQQQQLMAQQNNISTMHQQQLGPHSNVSGLQQQQQQQLLGAQAGNSGMQTNQHSLNMLQQPKVQVQQQTSSGSNLLPSQGQQSQQLQPPQMMQHMQSQPSQLQQQMALQQQQNQLQQNMQQRFQQSGSMLQQQSVMDQQKQLYQSQRPHPETSPTSMDSTAQTGQASGGDWQEEIYQKIKTMKEMYYPELNEMHQRIAAKLQQHDSLLQPPKTEQLDKLKIFKTMLERSMQFLQVPKNQVIPSYRDKLGPYEKQIVSLINTNKPRKPVPAQMMQQTQQPQSQITQVQSHENQMGSQLQPMNMQGSVSTMQQNNMPSLQQNSMGSLQQNSMSAPLATQQNMMNSMQPNSNLDSGQANSMNSMQQVAAGTLQQNSASSQSANLNNLSSQSGGSLLQQSINPLHSNSNMLQHQHIKQQQEQLLQTQQLKHQLQQRQIQQQLMQKQQILQQQQQQQQQLQQHAKQPLSAQLQTHQMSQMNQMNDMNDMKLRQGMGVNPAIFQPPSSGQRPPYQQLKPGTQYPTSAPQLLHSASPQIPQHSSPQIDQQSLHASVTKAGTSLQSATSPLVVPSPQTPIAPSPMPGEAEKPASAVPLHSSAGNIGHQPSTTAAAPTQSLAIGTPGISASPLLAEFTGPDGTHGNNLMAVSGKSSATEQPIDRLIKAVKSMSPKTLSASVSDIGSVVSMVDRIAGSAPGNGSRAAVGEDLVAMTKCRLQARSCMTQDGTSGSRKMRRYTSAMPLNVASSDGSVNDSLKQSELSDLESSATSSVKRTKIEADSGETTLAANHALLEEIKEINQRLIDTVVDISEEDVNPTPIAATARGGEGTIVKCSFNAVALSPNLKAQYTSAQLAPIQPLRLLVPSNYPSRSPVLLDNFPVEVSKEHEDLSAKAKSKLSISLRKVSEPMSVREIAEKWDICAREVISEYAQHSGGGSFSSKYGTWEDCLSAA